MRSTMSEERLDAADALIMLQARRDLLPSIDAIIDKCSLFGADGRREMDFNINWTICDEQGFNRELVGPSTELERDFRRLEFQPI